MSTPKTTVLFAAGMLAACQADSNPPQRAAPGAAAAEPPASGPTAPAPAAGALEQWKGYFGGSATMSVRILRSPAEWDAFWSQVQRPIPRPLDAAREMGLVMFLGERRTGGYSVEIVRVAPEGQKLIVEFHETTPAPDMMVTQALTQPWSATIVPRSELPAEPRKLGVAAEPRQR